MKVFTAKVMNNPSSEAVKAFHKRLAQILINDLGVKKCEVLVNEYSKEKEA
ncbi:hypothetical protein [Clostridium sp. HBUAS56017]|uniref:hypothetical protein n=1 Tax=Clostridium sp. HBUAS56017 TaxID=2571128 RepID=UPI00163D8405|nr:hypothetical protein [Clostridium sp. HBUAS56017]